MATIIFNLLGACVLFGLIWLASTEVIESVTRISLKAKVPPFMISFIFLGLLTSTTEISLAFNSHLNGVPEIAAGNLLGGIIVMFLLVIPVLAIFGGGVSVNNNYTRGELLFTLAMVTLPAGVYIDGKVSQLESFILLLAYSIPVALLLIRHRNAPAKRGRIANKIKNARIGTEVVKIIVAGAVLMFAADTLVGIVDSSAEVLGVSPFLLSLLSLSIGTNLPELVLVARAVMAGQKDIAIANYIGSALVNTLILGVLTFLNLDKPITTDFTKIFVFTVGGIILFFVFISTRKELSRSEGLILCCIYLSFVLSEILTS